MADVMEGGSMTNVLKEDAIFPVMAKQVFAIPEETKIVMGSMSVKDTAFCENDLEESMDHLSTIMQSLIMMILDLIVGTMVVAMCMPIFKMDTGVMQGREGTFQENNPNRLHNHNGFTLLELLFAIAIMGIFAAIAVPEWIQFEQDAALSSSVASLAAAKSALFRCGAQGTGATISAQYQQGGSTTLMVRNGNNSFCWSGHLQEGAHPLIGGNQLACTSVTATGQTSSTISCPAPQSGLWSVQYAGLSSSVP